MPRTTEPYRHRFIETRRHRNELSFIILTIGIYAVGIANKNTTLLWIAAVFSLIEKLFGYATLVGDLAMKNQVHLFDVFSAYISHFLLFNSIVNILLINNPANYDIANPTDDYTDSVNYTLPISVTQGFGDMVAKSKLAKYVQSAQSLDSFLLNLTFGAYVLSSFVGKIKI